MFRPFLRGDGACQMLRKVATFVLLCGCVCGVILMTPLWHVYYVVDHPSGARYPHLEVGLTAGPLTTRAPFLLKSRSPPLSHRINTLAAQLVDNQPEGTPILATTKLSPTHLVMLLSSALGGMIYLLQRFFKRQNARRCIFNGIDVSTVVSPGCTSTQHNLDLFSCFLQALPGQKVPKMEVSRLPGWCMAAAKGEADDAGDAPAVNLADWRNFRASLVEGERRTAKPSAPAAGPKPWAHMLGVPEPGCLLVAQPKEFKYSQHYFFQTVILLVEHDEDGTLGLILNRPTDYMMEEVVDIDPLFSKNPLYFGGDVGNDTRILHPFGGLKKSAQIVPGVYTSSLDQVLPVVRKDPKKAADVKFFTGYAGWGAGQLQRECNEDVWWVVAGSSDIALRNTQDKSKPLWSEVLELCGGKWAEIAKQGYRSP